MQQLSLVSLLVADYDEALDFYVDKLGFELLEDTPLSPDKRWVVVRPQGSTAGLLLAKATGPEQQQCIGNQTGGRVFLFLQTDHFARDYGLLQANGIAIVRPPVQEAYGTVCVFEDLYGNRWDLIQPR